MSRKFWVSLVGMIAVILVIILLSRKEKEASGKVRLEDARTDQEADSPSLASDEAESADLEGSSEGRVQTEESSKDAPPYPPAEHQEHLSYPSPERVRDEIQGDTHGSSLSVVEFSAELGPKMQAALDSEAVAHSLFQEFEECILGPNDQIPPPIQTVCLTNARILGNTYPELGSRYASVLERANPELVKQVKTN